MNTLLDQLKKRRVALGLKQHDMMLRIGVSRQQYQRLESKGNPRLDTLELIAKGLNSELILVPSDKLSAVKAILKSDSKAISEHDSQASKLQKENELANDPWKDLLTDDEK
ncbi:MAG: helix-turn-helix transcriptional regulator [Gammaproteobacteria bacterium]|nr:helix-turn-helix transcriptional regulator [Gammaproteobacteria bacterium]